MKLKFLFTRLFDSRKQRILGGVIGALLCSALPLRSQAGTYTVVYSGGTATPSNGNPVSYSKGGGSSTYGAGVTANGTMTGSGYPPMFSAATATGSGTITATFTWQPTFPGDDPPASVIVREDCSASATLINPTSGQLSASNGMGDASVPNGTQQVNSGGSRYTVKSSPGGSFSVTVTPSASATAPALRGSVPSCSIWVSYLAFAFPMVVDPKGTTAPTPLNYNILIGQCCVGNLGNLRDGSSGNPSPGVSYSNFSWNASGATFKAYEAGGIAATDRAWVVPLSATDKQKPDFKFYWSADSNSETMTCTATATDPQGRNIGTVQATAKVKVWAPYYGFRVTKGTVTVVPSTSTTVAYMRATGPGCTWICKACPPDLFGDAKGKGKWHIIQKIRWGRWRSINSQTYRASLNGLWGLDTSYPYKPDDGNSIYQSDPTKGWPDNSVEESPSDSPGTALAGSPGIPDRVWVDENFIVYMMYQPVASNAGESQWVPLHKFEWGWYGDANRPAGGWDIWATGVNCGAVTQFDDIRWRDHPTWTRVLFGLDNSWVLGN